MSVCSSACKLQIVSSRRLEGVNAIWWTWKKKAGTNGGKNFWERSQGFWNIFLFMCLDDVMGFSELWRRIIIIIFVFVRSRLPHWIVTSSNTFFVFKNHGLHLFGNSLPPSWIVESIFANSVVWLFWNIYIYIFFWIPILFGIRKITKCRTDMDFTIFYFDLSLWCSSWHLGIMNAFNDYQCFKWAVTLEKI